MRFENARKFGVSHISVGAYRLRGAGEAGGGAPEEGWGVRPPRSCRGAAHPARASQLLGASAEARARDARRRCRGQNTNTHKFIQTVAAFVCLRCRCVGTRGHERLAGAFAAASHGLRHHKGTFSSLFSRQPINFFHLGRTPLITTRSIT